MLAGLTAVTLHAAERLWHTPALPQRLFWAGVLLLLTLVLRPASLRAGKHLLDATLGRATVVAVGRRVCIPLRPLRARAAGRWDERQSAARDEEGGALWVLHRGRAESFFGGHGADELRRLAALLRQVLGVPADPPPLADEVPVTFSLPGWPEPQRGFVRARP